MPKDAQQQIGIPELLKELVTNNVTAMAIIYGETILDANVSLLRLLGYADASQLRCNSWRALLEQESVDIVQAKLQQSAGGIFAEPIICTCKSADGSPVNATVKTTPWPEFTDLAVMRFQSNVDCDSHLDILQRQEMLYRALADTLPAGVFLVDEHGRPVYINHAASQMTGYTSEEFLGGVWRLEFCDRMFISHFNDALTNFTAGRNRELRIKHRDGHVVHASASWEPLFDCDGVFRGLCIILFDITNQRLDREKLAAKTSELDALLSILPDLYFRLSADGFIRSWSGGGVDDLYVPPENVVGNNMLELLPPDAAGVINEGKKAALNTKSMTTVEYSLDMPQGRQDYECRLVPLSDDELMAVVRNVTVRTKMERALRESEERYRTLVANIPGAVYRCMLDREYTMQFLSDDIFDICGYHAADFLECGTRTYESIMHPDDRAEAFRQIWEGAHRERRYEVEYRVVGADGSIKWVRDRGRAVTGPNGEVRYLDGIVFDITQRKQAEEALQSSEERYRGVIESQQDLIVRTDPDGRFTFVNGAYCRLFGKSSEELLRNSFAPLVHPEDLPAAMEIVRNIAKPPYRYTVEQRALTIHGWRWIAWEDCAIFDDAGNLVEVQAIGRDITAKKDAERALRESEERYRGLVESQNDLVVRVDKDGMFTFVNDAFCRAFGKTADEWLGLPIYSIIYEEDISSARESMRALQNPPYRNVAQQRAVTMEGLRWIHWECYAIRNEAGEVVEIQRVGRDVTEQYETDIALRESEAKYKGIVENSNDVIMLTQPDGITSYISPACENILGMSADKIVGTIPILVHPEDREWVTEEFESALNGRSGANSEYRIIAASGEVKWLSHSWTPVFRDEKLQFIVNVIRDITEKKQIKEVVMKAHVDLERAYELQRQFLNNITHEVRTPLTAVQGYTSMLLEGTAGPLSEEQELLLRRVLQSSSHLLDIVGSLIEIARLKSGTAALHPKACKPGEIIRKALAVVAPQAKMKNLQIIVDTTCDGRTGCYDEEKLLIILTNLLSNAVKFTTKGEISIMGGYQDSQLEIIVCDSGLGVADSSLTTIFDEFQQLDDPYKHKPSGFGIGLAVVATMVEALGGSLTVSSAKGVGTAFTLVVPELDPR